MEKLVYLKLFKNGLKGYSEIAESNGPKSSLPKITFDLLKKLILHITKYQYNKRQLNSFNKQGLEAQFLNVLQQ